MKSYLRIVVVFISVFTLLSCETEKKETEKVPVNSFTVSGTIKGLDVPYVFIDYTHETTGDRVWDTVYVNNEHFEYSTQIKNTKRIAIWPLLARKNKESVGKNARVDFLARPGDEIEFKGEAFTSFGAIPTGTDLCDDMNLFNNSIAPINAKASELNGKMRALSVKLMEEENYTPTEGIHPKIKVLYDSINYYGKEISKVKESFIENNPTSEVSTFYLSNMVTRKEISDEAALNLLNSFDQKLMTSPFYIDVATRLKGTEATKIGNMAPVLITNRTLDGDLFDLTSLRGNYVLIDFWGTWCGPCVQEMPTVKEYSEKYKDDLVIVGINSGDTKQKIVDFVTKNDYPWIQLMSKKGVNDDNFVSKFNISGFPTKFIIDREGIIVAKYIGGSEDAFLKIDELINKK